MNINLNKLFTLWMTSDKKDLIENLMEKISLHKNWAVSTWQDLKVSYFFKICVLRVFRLKVVKLYTKCNKSRLERKIWACLEKLTAYEINIPKIIVSLQRFKT